MIGDGESYAAWAVDGKALGGTVTTWPFGWNGENTGPYTGAPALRFDTVTFQSLLTAGTIGASDPAGQTNNGQYVYVLAPSSVVATAPSNQQMTVGQSLSDFFFDDWSQALAAFPGQLAREINGVVGYAGNILANAATAAGGVVNAAASSLLTGPVLVAGGIAAVIALFLVFRKR
jgi:hypothetical protein